MEIKGYPVYIAPDYYFRIYNLEVVNRFPFKIGSLVELEGTLIYHGITDWVRTEIWSQANWSASLYPKGRYLSGETLVVKLRDSANPEKLFEFEWPVDHKTRLVVVSDSPAPPELFVSPEAGEAISVCLTMKVVETGGDQFPIILKPAGESMGDLILSEIRKGN